MVWLGLFLLTGYLLYGGSQRDTFFIRELWFQLACYAAIFYMSYLFLAPRLFFREKKPAYFISAGITILFFVILFGIFRAQNDIHFHPGEPRFQMQGEKFGNPHDGARLFNREEGPPPPIRTWPLLNFLFSACMVTGLSLGLRFSEKLIANEKLRKEAEKSKLNTELTLLKHQLNPHFLFNTLNSIYSLALTRSDKTPEAVMMLSDMMRYVIQDVEQETVPLQAELDYITQYVALQKIRLSEKSPVEMSVTGDPAPYHIAPMILVPFIENAFKFGTSSHEEAPISIALFSGNGQLRFTVSNRVFPGRDQQGTFGIGIQNTRQRLELIYPGKHCLDISDDGQQFRIHLEINFA